jgi:hypothetical protein
MVEDEANHLARSGCYVKNPTYTALISKPLAVPLKHMDYQLLLVGNVAQVTLEQHYDNPLETILELEYMLPI